MLSPPGVSIVRLTSSPEPHLAPLIERLRGRRIVALTGAGCSTESGIPDYRGPTTRDRARNPIQYRQFVGSAEGRQRYWSRSVVGWPRMAEARPNRAHQALAQLEHAGLLRGVITQNVDRLHHAAGSRRVVELHGTLAEVVCLGCGERELRAALQDRLLALNPGFRVRSAALAPDGDAEVVDTSGFLVPDCLACGGVLKPGVVFFGESVPRPVVDAAFALLEEGDALLVVGSSLAVFSGLRFVRRAARSDVPVAIVNLGPTRGDDHACVRVDGRAGEVLPRLAELLGT